MIRGVIMISYGKQTIEQDDIGAIVAAMGRDYLTQGPIINEFEEAVAKYCGAKFAVAFCNGTAALHGAYSAFGVNRASTVYTSPITFCATANAALYCGANVGFIDIDVYGNLNADFLDRIPPANTPLATQYLVPVHYAGNPCDMPKIKAFADNKRMCVIEDACHALGAKYEDGSMVGNCRYSDATVFSFHPVKSITTGEGGLVTTNSFSAYSYMKAFRTHGMIQGEMTFLGLNYRMTDIQAALGLNQLKKLDRFVEKRMQIYDYYHGKLPWGFIMQDNSSYHLFPAMLPDYLLDKKTELFAFMKENGVTLQTHYKPVFDHPYHVYTPKVNKIGSQENAIMFSMREVSLPIYPTLEFEDVTKVCDLLHTFDKRYKC